MKKGAAIVTTLRNAGATIDSFIAYHLAIGFSHFYLFFDDPADPDLKRIGAHPAVTAVPHDARLREAWRLMPQYAEQAAFIDTEVMARQVLNVEMAMERARDDGYDWLLHIDADELFFVPEQSVPEHFAQVSAQPFDTVRYANLEAIPERDDIGDFFQQVTLFKLQPQLYRAAPTRDKVSLIRATPQLLPQLFHFYALHKSAVRLSANDMRPKGVHDFIRANGDYPGTLGPGHFILHYACCGFENFWTKYVTLGRFSDSWWDRYDIAGAIGPLHLEARDVVAQGDPALARDFYRRRIAIEDGAKTEALIAAGILERIELPRRILAECHAGGR